MSYSLFPLIWLILFLYCDSWIGLKYAIAYKKSSIMYGLAENLLFYTETVI